MSNYRELLEKALIALKTSQNNIASCRMMSGDDVDTWDYYQSIINDIKEKLAKPDIDPVAYKLQYQDETHVGFLHASSYEMQKIDISENEIIAIPLYTSPPQQKPLSDDDIDDKARPFSGMGGVEDYRAFAREIEKAHGIGN